MSDELKEKKPRRGSGEGSIFKPAGSKNWYVGYYSGGKQVTESARTTVRAVAVAKLQQRIAAVSRGEKEPQRADRLLLSELFDDVLLDYEVNNYASGRDAEARIRLHLKPFFGPGMRAVNLSDGDCQRYIVHRRAEGAQDSTTANELSLLRRSFHRAVETGKLQAAPYIALPSNYDRPRQGFIEPLEFTTILSNLPEHIRPFITLAYFCGTRSGELKNLRWESVDLRRGLIRLSGSATKNGEARTVPVPPQALEVLREQRRIVDEKLPSFPFVFFREPRRNEKAGAAALLPIGDFEKTWQSACVASGSGEFVEMPNGKKKYIGKVVHDFRRSTARLLSRAGVHRNIAKKWLGHKTDSMYARYDIPDEADLERAAQSLGNYAQLIEAEASRGQAERLPDLDFGRRLEALPAADRAVN